MDGVGVVDDDTIVAEKLECRMKGALPPFRCPLCRSAARMDENRVPYGNGYITESKHIECPVCGIVLSCNGCHMYMLYEAEKHPCPEKLIQRWFCRCDPTTSW